MTDWFGKPQPQAKKLRQGTIGRRRLGYESLEGRIVLSGVPTGTIQGTVTNAATLLGQAGVTIDLTPSSGPMISTTTNASGFYSFTDLPGQRHVPGPGNTTYTGFTAPNPNPQTVVVTSPDTTVGNIDTFMTPQTVVASSAGPTSAANSIAASEALGGNRDLTAEIVSGSGTFTLASNQFGTPGLQFNSTVGADGDGTVAWDGPNATPAVLDPTGLDHADFDRLGAPRYGYLDLIGGRSSQ